MEELLREKLRKSDEEMGYNGHGNIKALRYSCGEESRQRSNNSDTNVDKEIDIPEDKKAMVMVIDCTCKKKCRQ
uniref:Uncharacterized protein n=1 Tax=Medicago truncatula TaxID=3880 RepID=Q2HSB0_MEDTR|nr:hypothetical protein MtrDRAFT_AC151598g31v2 [Medicago truncatula]